MDQTIKLSVGIPAHNEELNIKSLVQSLLNQIATGFVLHEIIVVSDGSTDRTTGEVNSILDTRIKLVNKTERKGQSVRQNDILNMFSGDVLLLLNADVALGNPNTLSQMVSILKSNEKIGVLSPVVLPLPAKSFFERVINYSVSFKQDMYENLNNKNNIYLCHGRARLFSGKFAKQFKFPIGLSEDAFSYIYCIENGFEFKYADKVKVFYRSPKNLKDHLKQSKRFFLERNKLTNNTSNSNYYFLPKLLVLKKSAQYFLMNPLYFICYTFILGLSYFMTQFYRPTEVWEEAVSSKKL